MDESDLQKSNECAQQALKLIGEWKLCASPENYALWFAYVGGANKELNQAVEECIAGGAVSEADCARLHEQFFSMSANAKALMEAGSGVHAEIANVQQILASARSDTSSYGSTLEGVSGQLAKTQDPKLMKTVIDNLVTATKTMAQRSHKLEQRLEQSKAEVDRLQHNIETARAEARTDQLTQLANRKAFDEAFASAMREAEDGKRPLCLIMGDIDHFKRFNDSWGHQTGDQVLRLVAHCMREGVRKDDVPARYGGEEFAVIAPAATLDAAMQIAERVRRSVESKRVMKRSTGEDLGTITMSLGVALFRPGENGEDFVKRTDACLYTAKRAGRNRVVSERQVEGTPIKEMLRDEAEKPARAAAG